MIDIREALLAGLMVCSAAVLTLSWLRLAERPYDPALVISAILLLLSLGLILVNIGVLLRRITSKLDEKERSLRLSLQSVEESLTKRLDAISKNLGSALEELTRKWR